MHFLFEAFERRPLEPSLLVWFRGISAFIMTGSFLAYFSYLIIQEYSGEKQTSIKIPDIHIYTYEDSILSLSCLNKFYGNDSCDQYFFPEYFPEYFVYVYRAMDNFSLLATNDELFNDPARSIEFEWTISRAPNRIYDEPLTPRLLLYPPQNEDSILGYNFKEDSLLNKMYYNSKILLHNSVLTLGFQNELYREIKKNDSSAILGVKPDFIEYSSVNVYEVTNIGGLPPNSTLNEISGTFYLEAFDLSMKIREEVKQHTVIATIGLAGGGYSTLTAVYILIFGTSRLTPWGLFHLFHRLFVRRRLKFKEDESLAYFTWNTSEATRRDMTLVDKQEDRNRLWLLKNPFSKSRTESAETIQQLGNEDVSRDTSIMVGKIKHENIERRNVMLTQDSSHSNDLQTQINDLLEERKEEINTVKALSQRVNELEYMLKAYYIDSSYLDEMGFKGSFDVISSTNKEV